MTDRTAGHLGSTAPRLLPLGVLAVSLAAYVGTLAPSLVKGDGGEFQLALATLGVPHATGYPLYTLLGWLWIQAIPVGSVAWRLNLLSAVCGSLTVSLVYAFVLRLTRRPMAGLAAAGFLAFSPTFWSLCSVTEVYALNALFAAALLYLLLVWRDARQRRPLLLVGIAFLFGLSLSHHRTIVLLVPAMGLFLILEGGPVRLGVGRHATLRMAGRGVALAGAFLLGLLPYLHVFLHEAGRGVTARRVLTDIILGGQYAFFLGLRSDVLQVLWEWPRQQVGVAGMALAALGAVWLLRQQRRVAALLSLSYGCITAFCLFYRVPDLPDFMVPATMILAICAGTSAGLWVGIGEVAVAPDPSPEHRRRWMQPALEGLVLLLALASLRNVQSVRASVAERVGDVEERARALLSNRFEPGALVLADWELATAAQYLVRVEGRTSNAEFVPVKLTEPAGCSRFLDALDQGVIVYLAPEVVISRLPDGYVVSPGLPLTRVAKGSPPYTPVLQPVSAQLELQGVRRDGRLLVLRWIVSGSPLAEDYTTYVHFFDERGQAIGQQDKGMGAEMTCWYPPTAWPVGQVVQDLFDVPLETASIRLGVYGWKDGQIAQFGSPLIVQLKR